MHLFFSTPVWISEIENHETLNKSLCEYIYSEKDSNPIGDKKSNVMGWHSKHFDLNDDKIKMFVESINPKIGIVINDMGWDLDNQIVKITNMWSIINKQNSFNERHHHGNSALSAAYYVKANKDSGEIVFYDPRPAFAFSHPENSHVNDLNGQIKSVEPKNGMLVLFPSYLEHSVNTSKSNEDRIVISFNISLIQKRFLA